jgi:polyisoprenyl-phosphate glycosyltransferase
MKVSILSPVFNDWEALSILIQNVKKLYNEKWTELRFLVVNDSSTLEPDLEKFKGENLDIIHLNCNLSHQRAIAVGLAYLSENHKDLDYVVVMDSDGEDKPEHIAHLLEAALENPKKIVFAERKKRTESLGFKFFYLIYKAVFKMLTGHLINFGNFSVIPVGLLKKISFVSEIWNNYPGGIIRSKLPLWSIPLDRGKRYAGNSKMNFTSLIIHGMSAISVFLDFTAVRIVLGIIFIFMTIGLASGIVLYIKFGLNQATPGWATTVLFASFSVALQCFTIALFILFMVLSSRRYTSFIPALGYKSFIDKVEKV